MSIVSTGDAGAEPASPQSMPPATSGRRRLRLSPLELALTNLALAVALGVILLLVPLPAPQGRSESAGSVASYRAATDVTVLGRAMAASEEWIAGRQRYAASLAVAPFPDPLPPAGAVTTAVFAGTAGTVRIATDSALPSGVSLQMRIGDPTDGEVLDSLPAVRGPYWAPIKFELRLAKAASFLVFGAAQSAWRTVTITEKGQAAVAFPDVDWAGNATVRATWIAGSALDDAQGRGVAPIHIDADIVDSRGDWSLPWRTPSVMVQEHKVTANAPRGNAASLELRGSRGYLGVVVWQVDGRLPRVRARRSDTRAFVGERAPNLPLFAAMTDRYAALQMDVAADTARDLEGTRMLLITADRTPSMPLFLEAIGHSVAPLRDNGMTLDNDAHKRAGLWLKDILGVRWTKRDIDAVAISDAQLAGILTSLGAP